MLSALIGAGSSLIGGLLDRKAADKQYKQQKEFAQSGIQWKVKDAEKAGIHPLYALGANTVSYSPQQVGDNSSWLGDVGQNIGRAIDATRSNPAKAQALAQTAAQIQLEGLQLDNDIKRAQLSSSMALARQAGSAPGLPSVSTREALTGMPGQGDAPQIEGPTVELKKQMSPSVADGHSSYGFAPEVDFYMTNRGGYSPQVPQSLSESFEQDWASFYQWYYRNKIAPTVPPNVPLAPLHEWTYHPASGQWYQKNRFMGKYWDWNPSPNRYIFRR